MKENYYSERDEINTQKMRQIILELPSFCNEFFIGIQMKTSALTRLNYAYDLRIFFDFVSRKILFKSILDITVKDLERLTAFNIELFLEHLTSYIYKGKKYKCNQSAKQRKLATLRSFFGYYFKRDKIISNVAAKVDMPKVHDKAIIRLEPNETAMLLDKIESDIDNVSWHQNRFLKITKIRDMAIISLFLGTGIRISELVGINIDDVDFSSNSFKLTRKGGNQTILYFTDEISNALNNYLNEKNRKIIDTSALFLSLQGTRITVRAVQNLVKKYASLVVPLKNITPHKLRSTFGTELYKNTQDIYIVADILGHKDVNTTKKHYAAISEDIRRRATKTVKLRDKDKRNSNKQENSKKNQPDSDDKTE